HADVDGSGAREAPPCHHVRERDADDGIECGGDDGYLDRQPEGGEMLGAQLTLALLSKSGGGPVCRPTLSARGPWRKAVGPRARRRGDYTRGQPPRRCWVQVRAQSTRKRRPGGIH